MNKSAKNIILIGATSAISRPLAKELAARGDQLYLTSRDEAELKRIADDLAIRYGTKCAYGLLDVENFASHKKFWQQALQIMGRIDGVIFAPGYLGNHEYSHDFAEQKKIIDANFTGAVSVLNECLNYFAQQKNGFILVMSSVAGDRGRQGNTVYNSAKAALSTYLQGIRQRHFRDHIRVITIKLGLVDTPMTFHLPQSFIFAQPDKVASKIIKVLNKATDVSYIPWFWRYIMLIVKLIPEKIFKRIKVG